MVKIRVKSREARVFGRVTGDFWDATDDLFPREAGELGLAGYEYLPGKNGQGTPRRHIALMEKALAERAGQGFEGDGGT